MGEKVLKIAYNNLNIITIYVVLLKGIGNRGIQRFE